MSSILLYLLAFVLCAFAFQSVSDVPAFQDGSALEVFVAGVLWMSSLVCLLVVERRRTAGFRRAVWLSATAGFFLMAIDETFMLHELVAEATEQSTNDHMQVVQLGVAGASLYLLDRIERLPHSARMAFVIGFALHLAYIVTEVGDGDYFQMPWVEDYYPVWVLGEYFEFLAVTVYFLGLFYFHEALAPGEGA